MAINNFGRKQRLLVSLNVVVMVLVATAILGGVWYLASLPQLRHRWDLTREKAFTLSPRTLAILSSIEKDVTVALIFEARRDYRGVGAAELKVGNFTHDLLREYEIRSGGRIEVENLDVVRDNLRVGEVLENLGTKQKNIVVVQCGDQRKVLIPEDLADIDQGSLNPNTGVIRRAEVVSYKAEAALTGAISAVLEGEKPVVCVLSGRGEVQVSDSGYSGFSDAAAALKANNFDVRDLNLAVGDLIPEDCDVLISAGPKDEYGEKEMAEIVRYLRNGGNLFLALSPYSSKSFDKDLLPAYGVVFDRDVSCRIIPDIQGGSDPKNKMTLPVKDLNPESRVTRSLAQNGFRLLFMGAGALNTTGGSANVTIEWLARSPSDVWGDTHPPDAFGDWAYDSQTEKLGMRLLGLVCEGQDEYKGSRLALFAESLFFTNGGLGGSRGNYLLFTNAINWLTSREAQLEIGPKTPYESRVELFPGEYHEIGLYIMIYIPCVAALLGLLVWWFRRR